MTIDLIPARPYHVGRMVRRLRASHRAALAGATVKMHAELSLRLAQSYYARALEIDGELVGIGGLAGTLLDSAAFVWIVLTDAAKRHSLRIVRLLRRELGEVMKTKTQLVAMLLPKDSEAVRLAVFLGFHVRDEGLGSPATCRRERAALKRYLESDIALRMKDHSGIEMIPVGYHGHARDDGCERQDVARLKPPKSGAHTSPAASANSEAA